jgi:hypothetical protein
MTNGGGHTHPPERLWTARTLVLLGAGRAEPGEEEGRKAHVDALRRRVVTGTYRIDAETVARAMLLEIAAGGV